MNLIKMKLREQQNSFESILLLKVDISQFKKAILNFKFFKLFNKTTYNSNKPSNIYGQTK